MLSGAGGSYPLRALVSAVSPAPTVTSWTYGHFSFVTWTNQSHGGRNTKRNDNFIELATLGQFSSISVLLNGCWLCRFSLELHYFSDSDLKLAEVSQWFLLGLHFSYSGFIFLSVNSDEKDIEEMCVLIPVLSNTSSGISQTLPWPSCSFPCACSCWV